MSAHHSVATETTWLMLGEFFLKGRFSISLMLRIFPQRSVFHLADVGDTFPKGLFSIWLIWGRRPGVKSARALIDTATCASSLDGRHWRGTARDAVHQLIKGW